MKAKPLDDLIALTTDEHVAARRLCAYPEFVRSWRPYDRELPDGRVIVEQGVEPSAGFIAAALAILRQP